MLIVLDNYDSFTWNLYQALVPLVSTVKVIRNDVCSLSELIELNPQGLIISPGPGTPADTGVCKEAICHFSGRIPVLGICLGHQTIAEVFGGKVIRAEIPVHGKIRPVFHSGKGVFADLPSPFNVTRYHSLLVESASLPQTLEITAWSQSGEIMGLRHRAHPTEGVQFHPEAWLTEQRVPLLANFVKQLPVRTQSPL
jgi:anthranilate synthase/aminodeoxychorismate synthase-like glutamine amidotransferase